MVGMLMEPVLACVLYRVLLMRFELSLRVLMTLAARPELRQCEYVWLTFIRKKGFGPRETALGVSRDYKDLKNTKTPRLTLEKCPLGSNCPEHSQSIVKAFQSIPRASSEHF
jgi:hypothetical protein